MENTSPSIYGHLEIVKYLVENGSIINIKNNDKDTPLYIASENNYTRLVKYFIKNGADANIKNNDGNTPLHITFEYGSSRVAEYLKSLN